MKKVRETLDTNTLHVLPGNPISEKNFYKIHFDPLSGKFSSKGVILTLNPPF
jgi:hypothetical protein